MSQCEDSPQAFDACRDFDVRARGAVQVVHGWEHDHDNVRSVWSVEGLLNEYNQVFGRWENMVRYYQENGQFPNSSARFSYLADSAAQFLESARHVESLAAAHAANVGVAGHDELRGHIANLANLLEEEGFALRAFSDNAARG